MSDTSYMVWDYPEPPDEPRHYCPVCGEETDIVYRDQNGYIVGCPNCVDEVEDWDE